MLDFTKISGGEKSCEQNKRMHNKVRACAVLEQVFVSATESDLIDACLINQQGIGQSICSSRFPNISVAVLPPNHVIQRQGHRGSEVVNFGICIEEMKIISTSVRGSVILEILEFVLRNGIFFNQGSEVVKFWKFWVKNIETIFYLFFPCSRINEIPCFV